MIALASDHAGFLLKEAIKEKLINDGYEIMDLGTNSKESVDYPIYGRKAGEAVAEGRADRGIVVCGTGIGISIAANKVKGIRCADCTNVQMAEYSRKHNNANMLALGARITTDQKEAFDIVDTWLHTDFEGGRHQRRVDLIENI